MGLALNPVFESVCDKIVDAFVVRAREVYGAAPRRAARSRVRIEVAYARPQGAIVNGPMSCRATATVGDALRAARGGSGLRGHRPRRRADRRIRQCPRAASSRCMREIAWRSIDRSPSIRRPRGARG